MKEKLARFLAPSVFKAYDKALAEKSVAIQSLSYSKGEVNLQVMKLRGELGSARAELKGLRMHEIPRLQALLNTYRGQMVAALDRIESLRWPQ